jgi:hypothetical protein
MTVVADGVILGKHNDIRCVIVSQLLCLLFQEPLVDAQPRKCFPLARHHDYEKVN